MQEREIEIGLEEGAVLNWLKSCQRATQWSRKEQ